MPSQDRPADRISSNWDYRDLPLLPRVWWFLFLALGLFRAAAAFAGPNPFARVTATGWLLMVSGVFAARRGLPDRFCAACVVGGHAMMLAGFFLQ